MRGEIDVHAVTGDGDAGATGDGRLRRREARSGDGAPDDGVLVWPENPGGWTVEELECQQPLVCARCG